MRVFILCTGRCGSMAFYKACTHFENYTSGHESNVGKLKGRLEYPDNHIEVDNRLTFMITELYCLYPDALYVHLKSDIENVAESYRKRISHRNSLIVGWIRNIMCMQPKLSDYESSKFMVESIRNIIDTSLNGISANHFTFYLETWRIAFPIFVKSINASTNISKSLSEFEKGWNAS